MVSYIKIFSIDTSKYESTFEVQKGDFIKTKFLFQRNEIVFWYFSQWKYQIWFSQKFQQSIKKQKNEYIYIDINELFRSYFNFQEILCSWQGLSLLLPCWRQKRSAFASYIELGQRVKNGTLTWLAILFRWRYEQFINIEFKQRKPNVSSPRAWQILISRQNWWRSPKKRQNV